MACLVLYLSRMFPSKPNKLNAKIRRNSTGGWIIFSLRNLVAGVSLIEVAIAMGVACLVGAGAVVALLMSERFSAQARLQTNARAIVLRNIEETQGVVWTKATGIPDMLVTTSATGVLYDDTNSGSTVEKIAVLRSGTNVLVSGSLTRISVPEPTLITGIAVTAQRVTYRVDYSYRGKKFSYAATTIRARDDQ